MRISDLSSDVCSSDLVGFCAFIFFMGPATFLCTDLSALPMQGFVSSPAWTELCIIITHITLRECTKFMPVQSFERSEERRVGKECVSKCRFRWSTYL